MKKLNPNSLANLKPKCHPFNSERASAAGKRSAEMRNIYKQAKEFFLNGKEIKSNEDAVMFWRAFGFKKVPPSLVMWTATMKQAFDEGNYKAIESFFKCFGIHFDSQKSINVEVGDNAENSQDGSVQITFNVKQPEKVDDD